MEETSIFQTPLPGIFFELVVIFGGGIAICLYQLYGLKKLDEQEKSQTNSE